MAVFMMAVSLFVLKGHAQNSFPPTGNVGIGTTNGASPLDIQVGGATNSFPSLAIASNVNSSSSGFWYANLFNATQNAANTSRFNVMSVSAITNNPSGANVSLGISGIFTVQMSGAGTVTEGRAVHGQIVYSPTAGSATNAECFYASTGIINNATASGTITNGYGYYMAPFSANFVNKYGVYINDPSASNYFGGTMTIGTTTVPPGYALAVNGSAIFTKAVVQTFSTWPDYVFKKGYQLPSLDSLADYIRANSHLPEMPSAGEVNDKGLDVGSNQAALLKKVEELTLYLILQNDSLKAQQQEIAELKKKVAELSSGR